MLLQRIHEVTSPLKISIIDSAHDHIPDMTTVLRSGRLELPQQQEHGFANI
jgi:hypothetical protein